LTIGILVYLIVPVAVVFLMTGVGLHLSLAAVRGVVRNPGSFVVCTVLQIVLLPAAALAIVAIFEPAPLIALVIVAISVSPGGALSNALTQLVGGNLALSILMTTCTTVLVPAVAPLVLAFAFASGMLELEVLASIHPQSVAYDLARFVLLPICVGLLDARLFPGNLPVLRWAASRLSLIAILAVLGCSLVVTWPVMLDAAPETLALAALFSLVSLALGVAVSLLLPAGDRSACVIEFGVRNLPIALLLATVASPSAEVVGFLLFYFVVNTGILVVFGLFSRRIGAEVST
jgi:BASS family bile acid:Na+ symporter